MPSQDVYGKRELVAVKPAPDISFLYGYRTNATQSQQTDLGMIPGLVNGNFISGLVLGADMPKPARMRRIVNNLGTDSHYASWDAIDDARTKGWSLVSRYKIRRAISGKDSKLHYIDMQTLDANGDPVGPTLKYCWPIPLFLLNKISADLAAMGIEVADANDKNLVFGCQYPKPPQAQRTVVAADGTSDVNTTFCDPKKLDNLPAGWRALSGLF